MQKIHHPILNKIEAVGAGVTGGGVSGVVECAIFHPASGEGSGTYLLQIGTSYSTLPHLPLPLSPISAAYQLSFPTPSRSVLYPLLFLLAVFSFFIRVLADCPTRA